MLSEIAHDVGIKTNGRSGGRVLNIIMKDISMKLFAVLIAGLALAACSGVNPNIGTRTADSAYQHGDCVTAMRIYQTNAGEGKPWAESRLGLAYYEGRCVTKDDTKAMAWLKKAASYESKTSWENGNTFSSGDTGFFNTRTSAANASMLLSLMYRTGASVDVDLPKAWLWLNRGRTLADSDVRSRSERERDAIEALMSREQLAKTKALAQTWTPADDPVR